MKVGRRKFKFISTFNFPLYARKFRLNEFLILIYCFLIFPGVSYSNEVAGLVSSNEPVEITSDSLEIDQKSNIAIFKGKVEAVQGSTSLHSDEMVVYYSENPDSKAKQSNNSISKIHAKGNVLLTTPEETASGAIGIYDVASNLITLDGEVIITKGDNVVKGSKLVYNLTSKTSTIISSNSDGMTSSSGGRVSGVFMPQKNATNSDSSDNN